LQASCVEPEGEKEGRTFYIVFGKLSKNFMITMTITEKVCEECVL